MSHHEQSFSRPRQFLLALVPNFLGIIYMFVHDFMVRPENPLTATAMGFFGRQAWYQFLMFVLFDFAILASLVMMHYLRKVEQAEEVQTSHGH
jgi:hypothetical protein